MLNTLKLPRALLKPVSAAVLTCATAIGTAQNAATVDQATQPQSAPSSEQSGVAALSEIVVTGSRFGGRIVANSPTPIDVVSGSQIEKSGEIELQQSLKTIVPSFSVSEPTTAGVLDFTSTPNLRGLGPGELLLLIDGKRRHSTGYLNTFNQIGRGDVGYDLSAIPTAAIDHVEILRDGASAQYGADAISGVMNVILSKSLGGSASAMTGITTEGDGFVYEVSSSYGFPLGSHGVVRLTAQYEKRNPTNRARPDTRQQYFGTNGTTFPSGFYGSGVGLTPASGTLDPREATFNRNVYQFGEPGLEQPVLFLNAELPFNEAVTFYSFGGYSKTHGDTPNFFRRPGQDETVRALHPDGFRPDGLITLENDSLAAGARGPDLAGFTWDLSTEYGRSAIDQSLIDSDNVSMGLSSPTIAYVGGSRFAQWTTNLDLTRPLPVGGTDPIELALGAEFRREYYRLVAGEPASYENSGIPILDGPHAGTPAPIGMQPTPGTTPQDATNQSRSSGAGYVELEKHFSPRFLIDAAARYEHYSDFGSDTTYKVATRLAVTHPLALRASFSTGFRAPNLAQSFYSATTDTFINGSQVTLRLFPVDNPVARALGATALRPEKSRNISVGAVFSEDRFLASLDVYQIKLRDRIALSSTFQDPRITALLAGEGFPAIGAVSYMTNGVDTTTRGVDLTGTYQLRTRSWGALAASLAANYNKTSFDRIALTPGALSAIGITTPTFDLTQQVRLTSASPKDKIVLRLNWQYGRFSANLVNTRYGDVSAVAFTSLSAPQIAALTPGYDVRLVPTAPGSRRYQVIQTFGAKIITDLSLSYRIGNGDITLGANNLLDIYPDGNIASTVAGVAAGTNGSDNAGTLPYNYISPFGFNGRFVYVRGSYVF